MYCCFFPSFIWFRLSVGDTECVIHHSYTHLQIFCRLQSFESYLWQFLSILNFCVKARCIYMYCAANFIRFWLDFDSRLNIDAAKIRCKYPYDMYMKMRFECCILVFAPNQLCFNFLSYVSHAHSKTTTFYRWMSVRDE